MLADLSLVNPVELQAVDVEQVVAGIQQQIEALEPRRRFLYVEWLLAHCQLDQGLLLEQSLAEWLSGMNEEALAYQLGLILQEAAWWRSQDDPTVARLLGEHFGERCL